MTKKTKNGFPVLHYIVFGVLIRQIGAHPMRPYTLAEWRSDSSLKQIFGR